MSALADSVFELSEEEIIAEADETGEDPQEEAEQTHAVLLKAALNKRLADLGHHINQRYWQHDKQGYHNNCLACGLAVSFRKANDDVRGEALRGRCKATDSRWCRGTDRLVVNR